MAPEVLRGKPYTPASDIYSFSMIVWEFTSGVPPFNDRAHDFQLSISICKGERPEIIENTPQCYVNLMKKCWDIEPTKRPTANEIYNLSSMWSSYVTIQELIKKAEERRVRNILTKKELRAEHPEAIYKSRLMPNISKGKR